MENPKVYCTFCRLLIWGKETVSWWGDKPYHTHHTPNKTGPPILNQKQRDNLRKGMGTITVSTNVH